MPRSQTAKDRPIAFVLHDTANNAPQEIHTLNIRPEDLTCNEPSRVSVQQTLGGAFLDAWGPGVASVNIAGHTGWGAGNTSYDGFEEFKKLHSKVFTQYHDLRAKVAAAGKDPNKVKLIFSDGLDDLTWEVAPQNFTLKRNKSRPLLSQYSIQMIKLAESVVEKPAKAPGAGGGADFLSMLGLPSLGQSIDSINSFANNIRGAVAAALGPLKAGIDGLVKMTSSALAAVRGLVTAGINGLRSIAGPVLDIAQGLCKVARNVMGIVSTIKGLPQAVKSLFMGVKSAFQNAFCLLRNAFKVGGFLPNYNSLYGASNCSSTSGGRPVAPYLNENVFTKLMPAAASPVSVTAAAQNSMNTLANADPLRMADDKAASLPTIGAHLSAIKDGVSLSTSVISKAIAASKLGASANGAAYV
jgi:hypothetical protein